MCAFPAGEGLWCNGTTGVEEMSERDLDKEGRRRLTGIKRELRVAKEIHRQYSRTKLVKDNRNEHLGDEDSFVTARIDVPAGSSAGTNRPIPHWSHSSRSGRTTMPGSTAAADRCLYSGAERAAERAAERTPQFAPLLTPAGQVVVTTYTLNRKWQMSPSCIT